MNVTFAYFVSVMALFFKMLFPAVVIGVIQYAICRNAYKWRGVLIVLCLLFLIAAESSVLFTFKAQLSFNLVYFILLAIPFGSPLAATLAAVAVFKSKNKKSDFEKMKIVDL